MDTNDFLLVACTSGILGVILGALLMYRGTRLESRQQLELRLATAEKNLRQQQMQVTEHFTHTAQLVSQLTHSYRELHEYLANSAQQLGQIDIQPTLHDRRAKPILPDTATLNPPLDYAPQKGKVGTLSEAYGLHEESQDNVRPPI